MSYYLNIYKLNHADIADLLQEEPSAVKSRLGDALDEGDTEYVEKLVTGDFERDPESLESEDAVELITALEHLCNFASSGDVSIEFYLDEDELPQLFSFSFDDWDEGDDFGVPLSPHGTPAVTYRDKRSLEGFLQTFNSMLDSGDYNEEMLPEDSLKDLIAIVGSAVADDTGLFIFCWQ